METFVCLSGSEPEQITPALLRDMGLTAQQLYNSPQNIAAAAGRLCAERGSRLCRLPFCNTLEAEALGAVVRLDERGARVPQPPYASLSELPAQFCLNSSRIDAVLGAVSTLAEQGLCVAYGATGVFTIFSQLLPMGAFFKALRRDDGQALLRRMEQACVDYAVRARRAGAHILSYADPVATVDIVGQRTFTTHVAPGIARLFDSIRHQCPDMTIFLCGKMTQSLLDADAVQCTAVPVGEGLNFEQVLLQAAEDEHAQIWGLGCLNRLSAPCRALYRLDFLQGEK